MGGVGGIKSNYLNFSWLDLIHQAFKTKFFAKYKPQRVVLNMCLKINDFFSSNLLQ